MSQLNSKYSGNSSKIPRLPHFLLVAASLLITACGLLSRDQGPTLGHTVQLEPQTENVLVCSQECASRGWCGTVEGEGQAVLGKSGNPVTDPMDRLFFQDTRVRVEKVSVATVIRLQGGERYTVPFYFVTAPDQGRQSWIPGWCIAAP